MLSTTLPESFLDSRSRAGIASEENEDRQIKGARMNMYRMAVLYNKIKKNDVNNLPLVLRLQSGKPRQASLGITRHPDIILTESHGVNN